MKRTSAQPEMNLSLLHSNSLKLEPLVGVAVPLPAPHPFLQQASGQIFKDDVNDFPSNSDICFKLPKKM
jgi:hypothetical protein